MKDLIRPLVWENETLLLLDQRKLPLIEERVEVKTIDDCYEAINKMIVRGAPLIGLTAIWGMVIWLKTNNLDSDLLKNFHQAGSYLKKARPTAVNLEYEIERCLKIAENYLNEFGSFKGLYDLMVSYALMEMETVRKLNVKMAKYGENEINKQIKRKTYRVLTLCNTGYLACGPMGTALGLISHMAQLEMIDKVWVSETRPYLQGSRLTSYELTKQEIDHEIIVEGAFSYLMREGLVDFIVVGADRIVRNGDVANKVGTSTLTTMI